ncbi:MAG: RNA 2',3'-cyclic phosphodiesterase [Fidelibacterota bacterium]|nr:MAG: RNA 2',3'-cyclic phosphodiesterase [Candidatus Neomarinimicrobiota bacterium]
MAPEDIVRTFFGFELPREVPSRAAGLRTLVDDPKHAVRWVKGENIHLTVRFLGATPRSAVEEIATTMPDQLNDVPSSTVSVSGTGVFPVPTRPRILWLGVAGDIARLQALEEAIHQVVGPMGFPKEKREYIPHITIGRVRYPQKITPDVSKFMNAEYEPIECLLQTLHLYESRPAERGVIYISLASFQLKSVDQEGS